MAPAARQALWFELMQFYIREAWLLDERQFKEWLDIFTDDVLYFMPRRKNVLRRELHREVTPLGDLAILEEDKRLDRYPVRAYRDASVAESEGVAPLFSYSAQLSLAPAR